MRTTTSVLTAAVCAVLFAVSGCKKGDDTEEPIPVDNTPVLHSDISPRPAKGCGGPAMGIHYGDAYKTLREAEEYKPGLRDYYVRELNDRQNIYLEASISQSRRSEWLGRWSEKDRACLTPLFDEIASAAKRTLPKYHPRGYIHHESGEDDIIKEEAKRQFPGADILATGVSSATWDIEKLGNGVPSDRYKYGMAWVKSSKFDDGYCRIAYINLVQDYSGGGNYAETKANYVKAEPSGCK